MSQSHAVAIDGSGRLVVPKALRDELGIHPGQALRASVRDGRLELVPEDMAVELVDRDGVLVITPAEGAGPLTRDDVRALLEALRR